MNISEALNNIYKSYKYIVRDFDSLNLCIGTDKKLALKLSDTDKEIMCYLLKGEDLTYYDVEGDQMSTCEDYTFVFEEEKVSDTICVFGLMETDMKNIFTPTHKEVYIEYIKVLESYKKDEVSMKDVFKSLEPINKHNMLKDTYAIKFSDNKDEIYSKILVGEDTEYIDIEQEEMRSDRKYTATFLEIDNIGCTHCGFDNNDIFNPYGDHAKGFEFYVEYIRKLEGEEKDFIEKRFSEYIKRLRKFMAGKDRSFI